MPSRSGSPTRHWARRPHRADEDRVGREYFDLFIGLGRGELLPYASYYLTGFLHERPLARLRADLKRLGIERTAGSRSRKIMPPSCARSWPALVGGRPGAGREPTGRSSKSTWRHGSGASSADLERCRTADFYARVGALGRTFMDIETEAFALPP